MRGMKSSVSLWMVGAVVAAPLVFGEVDLSKLPAPAKKRDVTYSKDIKPILQASCFGCQGEERQKGGLRLDSLEAVVKGGEVGKIGTPKASAKSLRVTAAGQIY